MPKRNTRRHACLVCFVNQLFINLGIPANHDQRLFSTNSATMLMPSEVIYSWHHHALSNENIEKLTAIYCTNILICVPSSFIGKIYTYHRSEHSPGVRLCKYLLVHLLTGQHVCFSYFAFTFCPLPVSITLSNILLWTMCLPGLSDQFESKKDWPKTGCQVKEVHKKHHLAQTKHNSVKFCVFYSVKLPFKPVSYTHLTLPTRRWV